MGLWVTGFCTKRVHTLYFCHFKCDNCISCWRCCCLQTQNLIPFLKCHFYIHIFDSTHFPVSVYLWCATTSFLFYFLMKIVYSCVLRLFILCACFCISLCCCDTSASLHEINKVDLILEFHIKDM